METIYTYTVIRVAAEQFRDQAPYATAIVERDDGSRFLAFLECREGSEPTVGAMVHHLTDDDQGRPVYELG